MTKTFQKRVKTAVPGPLSLKANENREKYVSTSVGPYMSVYIDSAKGSVLTDVDGNEYIDFGCGIGVMSLGHGDEDIQEATIAQYRRFAHTLYTITPYELYAEVAKQLAETTPGDFAKKSALSTTGAEAIENAVKVARSFTRRNGIAVVEHGYHGRTNLTLGMNYKAQPYSTGVGPRPGEIYRVPTSFPYRDGNQDGAEVARKAIAHLEKVSGADNLACFVIEPIQGEGGIVVPAEGYLETIQEWCNENGIIIIADEIQTGLGRTGKLFASEHFDFVPDIVVTAKAIGSGIPLSAITGRADVMDAIPAGGLSGTFSGNPVAAAAAVEVFKKLRSPGAMDHTTKIGEQLREGLEKLQQKHPVIGDVRGKGVLFGVELINEAGDPNPDAFKKVSKNAMERGLLVMPGGSDGHVLRLLPAVNISAELVEEALQILDDAFAAM